MDYTMNSERIMIMSDFRKSDFEVKWRIENVDSWLHTKNQTLYSPQFLAETLTNTRWKLCLTTNWQLTEKFLSLIVQRDFEDNGPESIALNYELSFLGSDGTPLKSKMFKKKFASKTVSHELNGEKIKILYEEKEAYLPENALTVRCKFWKIWSEVPEIGQCSIRSVIGRKSVTLDAAIDNFRSINESTNMTVNFMSPISDITIISFWIRLQEEYLCFERMEAECNCFSMYSSKLFYLDATGKKREFEDRIDLSTLLTPSKKCEFKCYKYLKHCYDLRADTLKLQLEITYYPGVTSESIVYDVNKCKRVAEESADLGNTSTSDSEKGNTSQLGCIQPSESEDISCYLEEKDLSDKVDCFDPVGNRHLPSNTLKEDLRTLHDDRLFCDTKLRTDAETFPAHRCVLSARSPVFKKMFTTDMKEAAGECINVPDLSSDTVRRMLQFIYTDCTGDLEMQIAMDLYVASDKYDMASLKQRCLSFMKDNLCPSNVCEILVLADMHQDKDLESTAHEFVLKYDKEVFGSEEWKLFMKKFSGLAAQVMYLKCMEE